METPEIDILNKVKEKRQAKKLSHFGPSPEQKRREEISRQIEAKKEFAERLLSLIDCDYKTFLLQVKSSHPSRGRSLEDLIRGLHNLQACYQEIEDLYLSKAEGGSKVNG